MSIFQQIHDALARAENLAQEDIQKFRDWLRSEEDALRAAVSKLTAHGYTVTPPAAEPAPNPPAAGAQP